MKPYLFDGLLALGFILFLTGQWLYRRKRRAQTQSAMTQPLGVAVHQEPTLAIEDAAANPSSAHVVDKLQLEFNFAPEKKSIAPDHTRSTTGSIAASRATVARAYAPGMAKTPLRYRAQNFNKAPIASARGATQVDQPDDLLVLSVWAKAEQHFVAYDLLQAIAATGMQFGAMNIFHYYLPAEQGAKQRLFSLAAATEPGEFDLNRMGEFSCLGLMLFMQLRMVPNPQMTYELMLDTAQQLAEDLDGELRTGSRAPWTSETEKSYAQRVAQFCATQAR